MKYPGLLVIALFFSAGAHAVGPVTGVMSMCVGNSRTLSCPPTGGTWSSSMTSVATVGSFTGIVTGVAAGTAVITYNTTSGMATATVTVHPNPSPILGPTSLCTGLTITLSCATPGGIWTSSPTSIANVDSNTGVVTGSIPGSATVTYTAATGCSTTYVVTVNPNPSAIMGTTSLCSGTTTTFSCSTSGGTWSSSPLSVATISGAGVVTGVGAGMATVSYTLATGCYRTQGISVVPCSSLGTGQSAAQGHDARIFPNPTNELLQIDNVTTQTNYRLLNLVGSSVQQGVLKQGSNSISVRSLPAGMYLLEVTDEEGRMGVRKVVKE